LFNRFADNLGLAPAGHEVVIVKFNPGCPEMTPFSQVEDVALGVDHRTHIGWCFIGQVEGYAAAARP
jgi:hypothetical protein